MSDLLVPRLGTTAVCKILGWSRWTLDRRVADKTFPAPERLTGIKENKWREPVIEQWLKENTTVQEVN